MSDNVCLTQTTVHTLLMGVYVAFGQRPVVDFPLEAVSEAIPPAWQSDGPLWSINSLKELEHVAASPDLRDEAFRHLADLLFSLVSWLGPVHAM